MTVRQATSEVMDTAGSIATVGGIIGFAFTLAATGGVSALAVVAAGTGVGTKIVAKGLRPG